ncbi:nuclear transcription factor Y subunit beta [Drosophila takahashii]|uniref:nuclear transcription factor Y subunit beta n=1 Tax=Drosophila takahashii TaxID=29030 RepID=UPI0038990E81
MKTFCLTLALCACLAAADVSHLQPGSSYLPPPRPEHAVSMSIEQQELRELPEQVEYMRPNEQGQMEPMPSSLLTPPAPVDQQEEAVPSTRYLPPAPVAAAPVQMDAEPMMMPQMEMAPEEVVMEKLQEQPELANRYLPPAPVSEQQLTYQQYQEQMQQFQMQEQQQQDQQPQEEQPQQFQDQPAAEEEQQMPYILDVQQPMAPSDVETQEQLEPEPAHELRADGYHYKQAEEQRRLRH